MLKFKVSFQDDIRRFDPSKEARSEIAALFASLHEFVDDSFLVRRPFLLKYTDDEGELITIAHESELEEAIRIAEEEKRKSLKIFVFGEPVEAEGATRVADAKVDDVEPPAENVSEAPLPPSGEPSGVEQEDESDRPTCEEIRDLFTLFMNDEEIKAVLPEAVKVFLGSLKEQQVAGSPVSSLQAFQTVFDAFPVIKDHEFIQSVQDKLPLVAEKVDKFAPFVANLDPDFVANLIPQVLSMSENFQNNGMAALRPLMAAFMGQAGAGNGGCPMGGMGMGMGAGGHPFAQMFGMMGQTMGGSGFDAQEPAEEPVESDEKAETVHGNVACDLCGVSPIVGIRFKCAECQNFDLCSECEAKGDPADFVGGEHTLRHVMIKYRKAQDQQWRRFFNSRFPWRGRGGHGHGGRGGHRGWRRHCRRDGPGGARPGHGQCPRWQKDFKKKNHCGRKDPKFKATSVEHVTLPDGAVVLAGQKTTKIWSITNNGEVAWPEGTVIQHMKGDRFSAFEVVVGACAPGETIQIVMDLDVVHVPGTYSAKYRLKTPKEHGGKKFGRPLWVNIEVVACQVPEELKEPADEPTTEQPAPEKVPQAPEAPAFEDALPVEVPEPVVPDAPEPTVPDVVPELEYQYQDSLDLLAGMGFGNIEVNKALLNEHKGNVASAIEALLNA